MKSVFLEYTSREFIVSDEGFEQVSTLLKQFQVCERCKRPFDENNPLVGRNLCLFCLVKAQTDLTVLGTDHADAEGNVTYTFLDAQGYVSLCQQNRDTQAKQSISHTLAHWQFPMPSTYKPPKAETEVALNPYDWSIYGNPAQHSVVVLDYHERYGQRISATFLSYQQGEVIEFTKRNGNHKQLLERARKLAESTKHNGYYHLGNTEVYSLHEWHLYRIIASMESAVYDVQRSFANGNGGQE